MLGNAGGLFGGTAPKPAAGGGLFGGSSTTPVTTTTGGLFGGPASQPAAGTSLFGGASTQTSATGAVTGGGLFGANTQQTPAGGAAPGGGLFGTNPPKPGGGLFTQPQVQTQQQQPQSQPQGSLFVGQNPTVNTTNPPQQQQQQGLLQPQQQQQQQQQQPQTQQQQQQPNAAAAQLNLSANDVALGNEKLNPLVQKWKRKIQNQSENLLQTYTQLGESIQQIEQCYKYYDNIASISQGLNGQFEQINIEVNNIEQYQSQIEQHLDIIRSKLTKQLELQGDNEANAFQNPIGEKIQGIDYGLTQIEKNVSQLIDEINPQKDQTQPANNTLHSSLNSYYQILEKLEFDTINLQFKLQSVAEKVGDQY